MFLGVHLIFTRFLKNDNGIKLSRKALCYFTLALLSLFECSSATIKFCHHRFSEGYRLNTTVFKMTYSLSETDCIAMCSLDECCRAINFRKTPQVNAEGLFENCEMLHEIETEVDSSTLQPDINFNYVKLLQPNREFNCLHCSTCVHAWRCLESTAQCYCQPGFGGLRCDTDAPYNIRLVGTGTTNNQGRVEVYHPIFGWGTVCDDKWDKHDGGVVCRQLGFEGASDAPRDAKYGEGTGTIMLDRLECTGSESYLWECPHRGWGIAGGACGHNDDASVVCY